MKIEQRNFSKLCFGVISIDNYAEVIQTISEERRAQVTPSIGKLLRNWISSTNGVVINHDRDKYLIVFEKKYLQAFVDDKFNVKKVMLRGVKMQKIKLWVISQKKLLI